MLGSKDRIEDVEKTIQKLLDSDISANEIEHHTGMNRSRITRLRNGERLLKNTSWETIKILYEYSKKTLQ